MKKYTCLFFIFFVCPAAGYFTTPQENNCGDYKYIHAIFEPATYTCDSGYYLPANTDHCSVCKYGYTCNGGKYNFDIHIDQGINITEYICEPGYFLPANTDGCRLCPSGYTCNGGTFIFNTTLSQGISALSNGIKKENILNLCSSKFPHLLHAKFVPNTVTITWDDNNGKTVQSTCNYGETISLPTPPTRPGYIFNGWAVKNN